MRKTILTIVALLALVPNCYGRTGHRGTTIGIFNGGGIYGSNYGQRSYGYRNVPFDGRYGIGLHGPALPHSVMGNYWPNDVGGYLNPVSGRVGNHFTDVPSTPKVTVNPFCAKTHKVAVQNDKGEWIVKDVPND